MAERRLSPRLLAAGPGLAAAAWPSFAPGSWLPRSLVVHRRNLLGQDRWQRAHRETMPRRYLLHLRGAGGGCSWRATTGRRAGPRRSRRGIHGVASAREPLGMVGVAPKKSLGHFEVNASVRVGANDRAGRAQLVRYAARPPFADAQLELIDEEQVGVHAPPPDLHHAAGVAAASALVAPAPGLAGASPAAASAPRLRGAGAGREASTLGGARRPGGGASVPSGKFDHGTRCLVRGSEVRAGDARAISRSVGEALGPRLRGQRPLLPSLPRYVAALWRGAAAVAATPLALAS